MKIVMPGTFIDFFQDYSRRNDAAQARDMLDRAAAAVSAGGKGAAIVYSANYHQTLAIRAAYDAGDWATGIAGANQAAVMMALEALLGDFEHEHLRGHMRIAPITTMSYPTAREPDHLAVVREDLGRIRDLLDEGWDVLGWMNQDSKPDYAVGGGVAGPMPAPIRTEIQGTLRGFRERYRS